MWTTNFYKSFSKNILLYMSRRLSKISSVHTYVMPRTVYFGWICMLGSLTFVSCHSFIANVSQKVVFLIERTSKAYSFRFGKVNKSFKGERHLHDNHALLGKISFRHLFKKFCIKEICLAVCRKNIIIIDVNVLATHVVMK